LLISQLTMKDVVSIRSVLQGAPIKVAMNQLVEMVGTIPEKLSCSCTHPDVGVNGNLKEGQVGKSETVAEECESRSAPDETTSRGATNENELRFDDLVSSIDEVASSITTNMFKFSADAQLSADELAKALMLAVDGCKSDFFPEEKPLISPEQMPEIQEKARAQTDHLLQVFEDVHSNVCTGTTPRLEDVLKSKDDLLDHVFEELESYICEGETVPTCTERPILHGKTNLTQDISLREAKDETPSQSVEECQVDQITLLIGNSAGAVVAHSLKHSDDSSFLEPNVCKGDTAIADKDNISLHWQTNLTHDNSLLEVIDETPTRSDEESQVEQITVLVGNRTVVVVEHGPKHSDESSVLERSVCKGDTAIADEDSTNLHGKTNLTRDNSMLEAKDETPSQGDEECQVEQITVLIDNRAGAVGEHGSKHSDERSCKDKENASSTSSRVTSRGKDKYHSDERSCKDKENASISSRVTFRGKDKYHSDERSCKDKENASSTSSRVTSRGKDKYHSAEENASCTSSRVTSRGKDKYHVEEEVYISADAGYGNTYAEVAKTGPAGVEAGPADEEASKASAHRLLMPKCFAFRRDSRSSFCLSSISTRASMKASTSVAPSTKAARPANTTAERSTKAARPANTTAGRESDHESAFDDEKRITGESSTGGREGTPENLQLWDDRLRQNRQIHTPKKRRNIISKAFRYIFGRKKKRR
jgi:hypothetical protein